jgi:hypothetical protein
MKFIQINYGAAIAKRCISSNLPPSFVAALIANETGGNLHERRFEKNVLASIWEVLLGRKAAFGSIAAATLLNYIAPTGQAISVGATLRRVDSLATSWGLTQIMGYQVIGQQPPRDPEYLADINYSLDTTARLLAQFAGAWRLEISRDFEQLFRCWNTGHPTGATADPQYVPNGLLRMNIYPGVPAAAVAADKGKTDHV